MPLSRLRSRSSVAFALIVWQAGLAVAQPSRSASPTTTSLVETTTRTVVDAHAVHQALLRLLAQAKPKGLGAQDGADWDRQSSAIRDAERRYRSFRATLGRAVKNVVAVDLDVAGAVIPGANVISTALSNALGGLGATSSGAPAGSDLMNEMMEMNMEFLALQKSMQDLSRSYTSMGPALKARADLLMNSIDNIRR